ncbi:hypothetical protein SAMN05216466_107154 [Paraburkholderia phenazinium]|uniref:Uncharacterized protein n=1 Tax=Paraburkholderia phenazinium TaxID=60549 RepID=A0A1G7ZSH5_9BURK|nr:hypothetical protein [Paraburkholderia phenazinium]SDH11577.1 hypothetical protein SAMN05216466_107154 [Paraburkholderia phenazinium]
MTLYAVFMPGSGERFAAPTEWWAERLADKLTAHFAEIKKQRGDNYPSVLAEVVIWPERFAALHAEELARDWAEHAKFIGPVEPEPERDTRTIDMFSEAK